MITAIRVALGTASLRSWSRFRVKSVAMLVRPVTFPPGRARFVTNPVATGSPTSTMTIGTFVVAAMAARAAGVFWATMTDVEAQQLLSETGESVDLFISEPHFDNDVSSIVPTEVVESLTKCGPGSHARFARLRREYADLDGRSRRLRVDGERRGEGPSQRRQQETAAVHVGTVGWR